MSKSIEELIERLKAFNTWRRYDGDLVDVPTMPSPKQIGEDIDAAIEHLSASLHPPVEQGAEPFLSALDAEGWLIKYKDTSGNQCRRLSEHNAVGDYRMLDPDATSEPLFTHPPIAGGGEAAPQPLKDGEVSGRSLMAAAEPTIEQMVPPGFVLVPVEPTEEMVEAAEQAMRDCEVITDDAIGEMDKVEIYKAMIAASPVSGEKP